MSTPEQVTRVAESAWLAAINRIVTPLLLAVMGWLGVQVWNDVGEIGDDVTAIKVNQAVSETKLNDALRRLDRLEFQRNGALRFQAPVNP